MNTIAMIFVVWHLQSNGVTLENGIYLSKAKCGYMKAAVIMQLELENLNSEDFDLECVPRSPER